MNDKKGFTLIEMLVVIAIIGLLSSIIVVGLSSSRAKSRDARRLSDLKQIQKAAEAAYTDTAGYPTDIYVNSTNLPMDPQNVTTKYAYCNSGDSPALSYTVAATLENKKEVGVGMASSSCPTIISTCNNDSVVCFGSQ